MFHGQESDASCCGFLDNTTDERAVVTYEALNLTITQTILDELQSSTSHYTDGNTGPSLLEWNDGIEVWRCC